VGNKLVENLSAMTRSTLQVTPDILVLELTIVNAIIVNTGSNEWVLVDTGLENSGKFIIKAAEDRFGKGTRPKAIILTHGHFDHVGSVIELVRRWDVPVYIHQLEIPYVTGEKDYPMGDPTVDAGMVAKMSPTFPHTSIDIGSHIAELPADGTVPEMSGWKWIHTPGHTEGHISLFREEDRVLIAGDAFATVKQESITSVISQSEFMSGPPKYLTTDWEAAKKSVETLLGLSPQLAIPSHGKPIEGEKLIKHLERLVEDFDRIALPK